MQPLNSDDNFQNSPSSQTSSEFCNNFKNSNNISHNIGAPSKTLTTSPAIMPGPRITISSKFNKFHRISLEKHGILQNPPSSTWYLTRKFQGIPGSAKKRTFIWALFCPLFGHLFLPTPSDFGHLSNGFEPKFS